MNTSYWISQENLLFSLGFSILLYLLQHLQPELLYHRNPIMAGEVWRLWTGNLVHTNMNHLYLNLAGFWIFILLSGAVIPLKILIFSIFLCMTGIGLGLWWINPEIIWYAGFSGILYGLFIVGGIYLLLRGEYLLFVALALMIFLKFASVWLGDSDGLTRTMIDAQIVEEAHLYGTVCGLMAAIPAISTILRKFNSRKNNATSSQ